MSETIDELTITWEEDGVETVKELEKEVLTKGSWTTILYKYQEWDKAKNEYKDPKATIRRYQKTGGAYKQRSKFNISNGKQAHQMIEVLLKWFPKE